MTAAFDRLAESYDAQWTLSPVGRLQRAAVWRNVDGLFQSGARILDLGCGTGEDALWLMRAGIEVVAIDASPEMVRAARRRGVNAQWLPFANLNELSGRFDGAISDFGPLNCTEFPEFLRIPLARLIRPGGHLALCVMGRYCHWETLAYLLAGRPHKAIRRWSGHATSATLGVEVYYHSVRHLQRALAPEFYLERLAGIGIAVPPSFIDWIPDGPLRCLASIDGAIEHLPLLRALSDHRLLIFTRV
jgi:ubiquinone/menaquinone biosynthesis C-methylase UbiE